MYRTILVPLDGTAFAERALPYAEALARASRARLLLVRAVEVPAAANARASAGVDAAVRAAEAHLGESATRLSESYPVETAIFLGDAAGAVLKETRLRRTDLVIMAKPAIAGDAARSSVCEQVIRQAGVPVLVVHAGCEQQAWRCDQPRRVLVPLDRSHRARAALDPARQLAEALDAEIVLLHVIERRERASGAAVPEAAARYDGRLDDALGYVQEIASALRAAGWRAAARAVCGDPPLEIAAVARELCAAAVAMTTRGHDGRGRAVIGRVVERVMAWVQVPVMLAPPEPAA